MNNANQMNWQEFKNILVENQEKSLQFKYDEGQLVEPSFHITEIKHAPIVSVDCGGVMNSWTEVIVQLWEPSGSESASAMKVSKALSIINLVEKTLPLNPLGIVKIEFGNSKFDTRQMFPSDFSVEGGLFTVNLTADVTQCKAIGRGGSCGTPEKSTSSEPEELILLESGGNEEQCCTPGGGCC